MTAKLWICVPAALVAIAALLVLVGSPEERSSLPRALAPTTARERPATPALVPSAVVSVHCSGLVAEPVRPDALAADRSVLAAAIEGIDRPDATTIELQDLGSTLTRLLLERPELGDATVSALAATHSRLVLFQLGRALRAVVADPAIEERLMAIAREATDARREAAILTLGGRGDARALDVFAAIVEEDCGPLARSAALYGLGRDFTVAGGNTQERALRAARGLAADRATPVAVRAEAFFLLGAGGLDAGTRALARSALTDPYVADEVALAAANALLTSGEPGAPVAAALRGRAGDDPTLLALVASLEKVSGRQP